MPGSDPILAQTCQALAARWDIRPQDDGTTTDYDLLLEVLTERVSHLMIHRNQKLMASLYILDISERRYKAAMSAPTHAARAAALARAILERETEKIASRIKYSAAPREGLSPPEE